MNVNTDKPKTRKTPKKPAKKAAKKAAAKKPAKANGKRQPELAGFERPHIPDLDEAALDYIAARDARLDALQVELDRKAILTQRVNDHATELECDDAGLPAYKFRDGEMEHTVRMVAGDPKPKVESKSLEAE